MIKVIAPTAILKQGADTLAIRWNDGALSQFRARDLRLSCPCAVCVNEWTGEKLLDERRIPENVKPVKLFSVGRYAMAVHWSDGHKTGIYSYDYLRKIDPGRRE